MNVRLGMFLMVCSMVGSFIIAGLQVSGTSFLLQYLGVPDLLAFFISFFFMFFVARYTILGLILPPIGFLVDGGITHTILFFVLPFATQIVIAAIGSALLSSATSRAVENPRAKSA